MSVGSAEVVAGAIEAAFGHPRVNNVLRAILVESAVDIALRPTWKWCSADYASFDFQHLDGTRLEVKQSAALQSWTTTRPSKPSYDIAPRTGAWSEGTVWVPGAGRNADLYLFAHHPVVDLASADHRNPHQWDFYVLPAYLLPGRQKTISLNVIKALGATAATYEGLYGAAEAARRDLPANLRHG